jgi:hypothetical protein
MLLRFIEYTGVGTVIREGEFGEVGSIVGGELVSHPSRAMLVDVNVH